MHVYLGTGGARQERGFVAEHDRAPCHSQHVSTRFKANAAREYVALLK